MTRLKFIALRLWRAWRERRRLKKAIHNTERHIGGIGLGFMLSTPERKEYWIDLMVEAQLDRARLIRALAGEGGLSLASSAGEISEVQDGEVSLGNS